MLASVKKSLFFTLKLLFFTLEKKPDLDIPQWRGKDKQVIAF
jgi:hypothetical protein